MSKGRDLGTYSCETIDLGNGQFAMVCGGRGRRQSTRFVIGRSSVRSRLPAPSFRDVAQGQRTCLGDKGSPVRSGPSRPVSPGCSAAWSAHLLWAQGGRAFESHHPDQL